MTAAVRSVLLLGLAVYALGACTEAADPRQAFVGTFAFASESFEANCSTVPEDHQTVDDEVELTRAADGALEIRVDDLTVPCADEAMLASAPQRLGCARTRRGVAYVVEVFIDNSFSHPNRLRVAKTFDEPAACELAYAGNLTPR